MKISKFIAYFYVAATVLLFQPIAFAGGPLNIVYDSYGLCSAIKNVNISYTEIATLNEPLEKSITGITLTSGQSYPLQLDPGYDSFDTFQILKADPCGSTYYGPGGTCDLVFVNEKSVVTVTTSEESGHYLLNCSTS